MSELIGAISIMIRNTAKTGTRILNGYTLLNHFPDPVSTASFISFVLCAERI
jgi:hypothetical protein